MHFQNHHANTVFLKLIFEGHSDEEALKITNNYINSCLNIIFLLNSKMK